MVWHAWGRAAPGVLVGCNMLGRCTVLPASFSMGGSRACCGCCTRALCQCLSQGVQASCPPHIVPLPKLPVPPTCMTPLPRESEAACDSGSCAPQGGPLPMAPGPSNSDSQPSSHELRDHSLDRSRDEPPGPKKPRACLGVLYFNQRRYDAQKPPVRGQGGAGRCIGRVAGAPGGWRVAGVGRVGEEGGGRRS